MSSNIERGLLAWSNDYDKSLSESYKTPLPQVDIIPLLCVWALAAERDELASRTAYDFTQAVVHHERARLMWSSRARRAKLLVGSVEQLPLKALQEGLNKPGTPQPYRFDAKLLSDGRPQDQEYISTVEYSLVQAAGHAMYNSTSGGIKIHDNPLGPHPDYPDDFLRVSNENVYKFVDDMRSHVPEMVVD